MSFVSGTVWIVTVRASSEVVMAGVVRGHVLCVKFTTSVAFCPRYELRILQVQKVQGKDSTNSQRYKQSRRVRIVHRWYK